MYSIRAIMYGVLLSSNSGLHTTSTNCSYVINCLYLNVSGSWRPAYSFWDQVYLFDSCCWLLFLGLFNLRIQRFSWLFQLSLLRSLFHLLSNYISSLCVRDLYLCPLLDTPQNSTKGHELQELEPLELLDRPQKFSSFRDLFVYKSHVLRKYCLVWITQPRCT